MAVFLNGQRMAKPLMNGVTWNALYNGRKLWATPADTVTKIEILSTDGKPAPTTLPVDGTVALAARATYADGHQSDLLTDRGVTWASLDTSVATMSGNTVTWKHGGTALITARVAGFTSAALSIAAAYAPESVSVSDDAGKPVGSVTLRAGESMNLQVKILPMEASQEFTAASGDGTVAVVGDAKPTGITVSPEPVTLRVGETTTLDVNILPAYAPQEFTADIEDKTIATINSKE
ncbi:Ig-like domain-containing protein [Bifidobacterium platyrrhinorum]|uniref:BIG2 domain-containing protein n=1 Tax=Bifidobacterium platyrrhinorum TaxID=2661628 RepID=A0A6L9SSI4_9BIFI|nr:Ig-like domain-containing protein [Bifidobacterium platyrrhinorum]NEG55478.1 hypothetical protein [Bifidobacterium platyrrhinorum]